MHLHIGDLTDAQFILELMREVKPNEVYNLAAQSHVHHSFNMPQHNFDVNTAGLLNILQAIKILDLIKKTKVVQASTSEMFGYVESTKNGKPNVIDESFVFNPMSPYAVSKIGAFYLMKEFRMVYGMFCCNSIAFNHESPLRHEDFITRKITKAVSRIKYGL